MTHLDTLRAIAARASLAYPLDPVDADLREEAGMDGNLARLLQAARDLDRAASNLPPGSMLSGSGAPGHWFDFTLAFDGNGADLDTVRASLGLSPGWVVHVEPAVGEHLDLVFSRFEQDDDPARNWPVYLVGHRYDDGHSADDDYRGEPVRIPLAGARITVY